MALTALIVCSTVNAQFDVSYDWARAYSGPGGMQSYAMGAAVLDSLTASFRGTVVTAGYSDATVTIMAPTPSLRGYVAFLPPDGVVANAWLRQFPDGPLAGTGTSACTGVCGVTPLIEAGRVAFASGWFTGDTDFGSSIVLASNGGKDAFIAKLDRDTTMTRWVTRIGGLGDQEALAVGSGGFPGWTPSPTGPWQPTDPIRRHNVIFKDNFLAVGGCFNSQIVFPAQPAIASNGNEDAYLAILRSSPYGGSPEGAFIVGLRIGGTGNERITAVAMDPLDGGIFVAGYYSSPNLDFDPDGSHVIAPNPVGGTDIFVARYFFMGIVPDDPVSLRLDWLYASGTSGEDQATAVAMDVRSRAYATGWRDGGANGQDLWIARIDQHPDAVANTTTTSAWGPGATGLVYSGAGDDAGLGITVDGIDRVLVTGRFGHERTDTDTPDYTLDFDPTTAVENKSTHGGWDMFVTRLSNNPGLSDPIYDGTQTVGAAYNEIGAAVAIDPVHTQRLAVAGSFGGPNSPSGYSVDFNPGTGVANRSGTGGSDGYVLAMLPTVPETLKTAISLALDNSGSINDDPDYTHMYDGLRQNIEDPNILVASQPRVVLNAALFDVETGLGTDAEQILPWTVLNSRSAGAFARRLANQSRRVNVTGTPIDNGIRASRDSFDGSIFTTCYRHVMVVGDGWNRNDPDDDGGAAPACTGCMVAARNDVIGNSPDVDQINAIAVRGDPDAPPQVPPIHDFDRVYLADFVIASDAVVSSQPFGLGLALHTDGIGLPPTQFEHPSYPASLDRMLRRLGRCPADFDRDGDVDNADQTAFTSAYMSGSPDADWNFDGLLNSMDLATYISSLGIGCCP